MGSFSKFGYLLRSKLYGWDGNPSVAANTIRSPQAGTQNTGERHLTAVITGFSSGIGLATAAGLARSGWRIIGISGNKERCTHALKSIVSIRREDSGDESHPGENVFVYDASRQGGDCGALPPGISHAITANVAELSQIDEAVKIIRQNSSQIDLLIHCAGKIYQNMDFTEDGFESTLALHVLGPHLLTKTLLDVMTATGSYMPRVIWVSSGGMYAVPLDLDRLLYPNRYRYRAATAYAYAKRIQVELAEIWAVKLADSNRLAFSMHPGFVDTRAIREGVPAFTKLMKPFLRTPEQGADTLLYLATLSETKKLLALNGSFLLDRKPRSTSKIKSGIAPVSKKILTFDAIDSLVSGRGRSK